MKVEHNCRECAGRGSNYGYFCDACNGTGIASDPGARRIACLGFIVLNAATAWATWYWWPW